MNRYGGGGAKWSQEATNCSDEDKRGRERVRIRPDQHRPPRQIGPYLNAFRKAVQDTYTDDIFDIFEGWCIPQDVHLPHRPGHPYSRRRHF